MNTTDEKIMLDNAITSICLPYLKVLGFNKRNRVFYKQQGDFNKFIHFEGFYTKEQYSVNLGVLINKIPRFFNDNLYFFKPHQTYSHFNQQAMLGKIYANQAEMNEETKKIIDEIKTKWISWLDHISNYKNIVEIYEKNKDSMLPLYHVGVERELLVAYAYEQVGDNDSAYICITNFINSQSFKFGKGLQNFAKELQERTKRRSKENFAISGR